MIGPFAPMALSLIAATNAFHAPLTHAVGGAAPAVSMYSPALDSMPGKYSLKPIVFDPLNLSDKYDLKWLREAELKHGRVCMLGVVGWLANDAGIKLPGDELVGVSSLEAHDVTAKTGHLWALLFVVGVCESLHMSVVVPKLDGDWGDYEPGNYGLDPFSWCSDKTKEAELKHGRLAMFAFAGLATQSALGFSPL